ncbi:MAG: DUF58 domain-containing protein [Bacteroidia bacterium]
MDKLKAFYYTLFIHLRLFVVLGVIAALFMLSYFYPTLERIAEIGLWAFWALLALDFILLYSQRRGIIGSRDLPEKFSNGDFNEVKLKIESGYAFPVFLHVIDEIPVQFQRRDFNLNPPAIKPSEQKRVRYLLRPTERGEYHFGALNIFVTTPICFLRRRYQFDDGRMVPTYPSFLQMRKYQFMAVTHRLADLGVKKVRRLGHTTEFEQIKEYVRGDDYRTVNWKATARSNKLMVNQYADEKSQNVYCLLDMGRSMKMPFEEMSLLDYAVNASLVMSNLSLFKQDKPGLITFAEKIHAFLPPSSRPMQMNRIQEILYNQRSRFLESDYARLYTIVRQKISHRSLLVLFTNFETLTSLRRQLPYLQKLAASHLLVTIFFENTELNDLLESSPRNTEEVYIKTVAENFHYEKKQIIKELERAGIIAILTQPQQLTVNTINKYLEIKARGLL